eukprot:EG_transcript_28549
MFQMVLFPFPLKATPKMLHKMQKFQNLCQIPMVEFGFKHHQDRLRGQLGNPKIKTKTLGKAKVSRVPKIIKAKDDMGEGGPANRMEIGINNLPKKERAKAKAKGKILPKATVGREGGTIQTEMLYPQSVFRDAGVMFLRGLHPRASKTPEVFCITQPHLHMENITIMGNVCLCLPVPLSQVQSQPIKSLQCRRQAMVQLKTIQ